jgi:hypothetical protein
MLDIKPGGRTTKKKPGKPRSANARWKMVL